MDEFTPSAAQIARLARSTAVLDHKRIPRYHGPLYTEDGAEVTLRSPADTARRALVLWAVALRADGMPQQEALHMLDQWELWSYVSPKETRYIRDPQPDADESFQLVWRLEAVWVLMWALGRIDTFGWPALMCDVPALVEVLQVVEADPAFIETAQLRSKQEILDALDLTMRLHWATRNAWLAGIPIRSDLNWTAGIPDVLVTDSTAAGVIQERHKTLNWLTCFGDADWDEVGTPT